MNGIAHGVEVRVGAVVFVRVAVLFPTVGVRVDVVVLVRVGVLLGTPVEVLVRVGVCVKVPVIVNVGVVVKLGVRVGVCVTVGDCVKVSVGVGVPMQPVNTQIWPVMDGWITQWYGKTPGVLNVNKYVPFGLMFPLFQLPVSLVEV